MTRSTLVKNLIRTVFGLFIFAAGVALEMQSNIGMAPWETFAVGVANHVPFRFGTVHVTISLIIVVIDLLMKEKIGTGTVLDALLVGNFADLIVRTGLIPLQHSILSGAALLSCEPLSPQETRKSAAAMKRAAAMIHPFRLFLLMSVTPFAILCPEGQLCCPIRLPGYCLQNLFAPPRQRAAGRGRVC